MSEVLKIEPRVGFLAVDAPPDAPDRLFIVVEAMPAGIALIRFDAADVASGSFAFASLAAFCTANDRSITSLRKTFEVDESSESCSSGTVSRFFSRKPSLS